MDRHGIFTNFTRKYVFIKSFTPKYSVSYDFHGHEENINLPLCYLNIVLYTCLCLCYSIFALLDINTTKRLQNSKEKIIYNKLRMFKTLFYPRKVKFYTDNVRASVTNSMSCGVILGRVCYQRSYPIYFCTKLVPYENMKCWRTILGQTTGQM